MNALYLVVPLALVIAAAALTAFIWSVRSGQLDDVDTPPRRMLLDDEVPRDRPTSFDADAEEPRST